MDINNVTDIVNKEISCLPANYCDVKQYFVPPEKIMVTTFSGNQITLWKIFKKDEYLIMYSSEKDIFGLAFNNIVNELIYLGGSGRLLDAIDKLLSKDSKDSEE